MERPVLSYAELREAEVIAMWLGVHTPEDVPDDPLDALLWVVAGFYDWGHRG